MTTRIDDAMTTTRRDADRRRGARRVLAALAATVTAGGLVTACGSSEPSPEVGRPQVMSAPGAIRDANGCAGPGEPAPSGDTAPRTGTATVRAGGYAVSTANPLATEAACRVLSDGGTAADALVAAQAVLSLVEPQSSGLGGGGFALYHDASSGRTRSFDGMETAPAAALPDDLRSISGTDPSTPRPDVRASGRSIGVPGIVRLLGELHSAHGAKDLATDLEGARRFASDGFRVSPRLAEAVSGSRKGLETDPAARAYLLPGGRPVAAGDTLRNPAYADTLRTLAEGGVDAFYTGPLAESVARAAADTAGGRTESRMTAADLAGYHVTQDEPLCVRYRAPQVVCVPHAPESGGTVVAESMGILARHDLPAPPGRGDGADPAIRSAHLMIDAERLAFADRGAYSGDEAFVPPPGGSRTALIDDGYLDSRAREIEGDRELGAARPGLGDAPVDDHTEEGTSHVVVVDAKGNAASLTTSLQSNFGSYHLVGGFFLNNHLENFSADPTPNGRPVANALAGGKRPRSAMAPTMVFGAREDGTRTEPFLLTGSPGGSEIPAYVVKTLVAMLDWGLDPQSAATLRNVGAISRTEAVLESGWGVTEGDAGDRLDRNLDRLGPTPEVGPLPSGTATLLRDRGSLVGGADPRREGSVAGGPPA